MSGGDKPLRRFSELETADIEHEIQDLCEIITSNSLQFLVAVSMNNPQRAQHLADEYRYLLFELSQARAVLIARLLMQNDDNSP